MISAASASNPNAANVPAFPGILANARYVYVAAMMEISSIRTCFPKNRDAIGAVQEAIHNWGN